MLPRPPCCPTVRAVSRCSPASPTSTSLPHSARARAHVPHRLAQHPLSSPHCCTGTRARSPLPTLLPHRTCGPAPPCHHPRTPRCCCTRLPTFIHPVVTRARVPRMPPPRRPVHPVVARASTHTRPPRPPSCRTNATTRGPIPNAATPTYASPPADIDIDPSHPGAHSLGRCATHAAPSYPPSPTLPPPCCSSE